MRDWQKVGAVAGVIAAVVAVIALGWGFFIYVWPPANSANNSGPTDSAVTPPPASGESPSAPPPAPVSAARLVVQQTCHCPGPRNQYQVKLQLSVTNSSNEVLNAAIANIRLLVRGDLAGSWTPVQPVGQTTRVIFDGKTYTSVPANGNKVSEPQYGTWASHWYAGSLSPGQTYSGQGPNQADIVFYVPNGQAVDGVALVTNDGGAVLGWQPTSEWPPDGDPHTF